MWRLEKESSRDKKDTTGARRVIVLAFGTWEDTGVRMRSEPGERLKRFDCPVYGVQRIINGKYKLRILWDLQHGSRRYGEIRKKLLTGISGTKAVTPRVLSRELKSLIQLDLLKRTDHQVLPKKVEYELTALGLSLVPVIAVMHKWGVRHLVRESLLRKLGLFNGRKDVAQ
jgi:DNA-binding HxlR family transcriptional regulator